MLCHNLPRVTGNFLLLYLLLTCTQRYMYLWTIYEWFVFSYVYTRTVKHFVITCILWSLLHSLLEFFFPVKVQYMGSPFHLQASKVLSHLFTMSLHWTARYGRPPCQFRPHPDSTPVGQNCCRTLIIVFWNVLSNFKEVIHLCIRSKAFVTGAIFCQQNLSIWGSFRE